MKEIQEKIKEMVKKFDLESSPEIRFIDLVSEIGELGKEILKGNGYGRKEFSKTDNLESEVGDALFSLICIANGLDIDLNEALDGVLTKYESRFSEKGNIGSGK